MIKIWQDVQKECNKLIDKSRFGGDNELPKWAGKGHSTPSNIVVVEVRDHLDP